MSLDLNAVKFLFWAKNLGVRFDRTAMLGRQGLSAPYTKFSRTVQDFGIKKTAKEIERVYERSPMAPLFAEELLHFLGAQKVESIDRSDFEGATLLHDLNKPFIKDLQGSFDLVIDGGTLEHIFYYQNALTHCLDLLRAGGHMVLITPANGNMGHGFYQFSPELFFRFFSAERGFALRKVIVFDCSKTDAPFYEVTDPALTGQRSPSADRPVMLAVLVQKIAETPANLEPPQQSDYVAIWESSKKKKDGGESESTPGFIRRLRLAMNPYWPLWLRDFRDEWLGRYRWRRGLAQQGLHNFRRISPQEMFDERSD